eukprot:922-Rhodomonas_salina.1
MPTGEDQNEHMQKLQHVYVQSFHIAVKEAQAMGFRLFCASGFHQSRTLCHNWVSGKNSQQIQLIVHN